MNELNTPFDQAKGTLKREQRIVTRALNLAMLVTSLFGYLQWGTNKMFLFEMEAEIISKMFVNPMDVVHPFTILPLLGQVFLLITLFQKYPGRYLTIGGVLCIGLLLGFMFIIGLISMSVKIALASLPFNALALAQLFRLRRL